jgi:hypothetical protein
MSLDPLTAAFDIGKSILTRVWPDPKEQALQLFKLEELKQNGDLAQLNAHVQSMAGQLQINLADAKSGSIFQAGWRPAIGWVGAVSLALMYIPKAIVMTVIWTWQNIVMLSQSTNVYQVTMIPFPNLGAGEVIGLLGSMLGVAILRSHDKKNNTDTR